MSASCRSSSPWPVGGWRGLCQVPGPSFRRDRSLSWSTDPLGVRLTLSSALRTGRGGLPSGDHCSREGQPDPLLQQGLVCAVRVWKPRVGGPSRHRPAHPRRGGLRGVSKAGVEPLVHRSCRRQPRCGRWGQPGATWAWPPEPEPGALSRVPRGFKRGLKSHSKQLHATSGQEVTGVRGCTARGTRGGRWPGQTGG